MSTRLDYVKFDDVSAKKQAEIKAACLQVEHLLETHLSNGRNKARAFTHLEDLYAAVGRQIRDDQIERNGSAELQEGRGNS